MGAQQYGYTIKELPEDERPREKLIKYGAEKLSNSELLALIIRTGNINRTAIELSQDILHHFGGLRKISSLSVEEMMGIKGVGQAKATQLKAVMELSKRLAVLDASTKKIIKSPQDVAALVMPDLRFLKQEIFELILLDIKNQVITVAEVSKGGLSSSIVHPREVFREAIRRSCAAIILVHNHPSGIPEPSKDDINVTTRLIESGKIVGIDVLDHIIIGDGVYVSMKEKGII